MKHRLGRLGQAVTLACAALFSALIVAQSLRAALAVQPFVVLAGGLGAAAVLLAGTRLPLSHRGFLALLFCLRFALALGVALWLRPQPVQDFLTMYQAAVQLAEGSHAYLDNPYFFNWAYQSGFVAYQAAVIRLFGPGLLPLQLLNALFLAGTGCLVYLMGCALLPQRGARAAALLYALYPAPLLLAGVLTNQHLAAFLFYLGLWLTVERGRLSFPRALLAGALLALGSAMRPIGSLVVLAVSLAALLHILEGGERPLLPRLARIGGLAASYFLVFFLLAQGIVATGINPEGLSNNQPMWKFLVGLNQDSRGSWNRADYDTYLSLPADRADDAMRQEVLRRLSAGPLPLAKLALNKSAVMWGDCEDLFWGFGHIPGDTPFGPLSWNSLQLLLSRLDKGVYLAAFLLAFWGLLPRFRRGKFPPPLLPAMLFCGYYAAHLAVEVQSRYRYFIMPCVFLLAGWGLARLLGEDSSGR